ncbi:hypothetical protein HZF02_32635 (plasmid) [Pseudomonas yamanorum]|nr:hypothetical protein HZF02_32635 [Pseudomonas yamanorum]
MRKIFERVPRPFYLGLLFGVLVAGYGWVGESDYQQAVAGAEFYCQMSDSGAWPVRPELNCPVPKIEPSERLVGL